VAESNIAHSTDTANASLSETIRADLAVRDSEDEMPLDLRLSLRHGNFAIFRGILVGIGDSLSETRQMLDTSGLEKIVLWYHDMCRKYRSEKLERDHLERFLRSIVEWFGSTGKKKLLSFSLDSVYFRDAGDPLEAIERFLNDMEAIGRDDAPDA